jgi:hypothetical protein
MLKWIYVKFHDGDNDYIDLSKDFYVYDVCL